MWFDCALPCYTVPTITVCIAWSMFLLMMCPINRRGADQLHDWLDIIVVGEFVSFEVKKQNCRRITPS